VSAGPNDSPANRTVLSLRLVAPRTVAKCLDPSRLPVCGPADPHSVLRDSATWHHFRDAYREHFASMAKRNEHGIEEAARLLGHLNPDQIHKHYVKDSNRSNGGDEAASDDDEHQDLVQHTFR